MGGWVCGFDGKGFLILTLDTDDEAVCFYLYMRCTSGINIIVEESRGTIIRKVYCPAIWVGQVAGEVPVRCR